jgi:hypothetical protein
LAIPQGGKVVERPAPCHLMSEVRDNKQAMAPYGLANRYLDIGNA